MTDNDVTPKRLGCLPPHPEDRAPRLKLAPFLDRAALPATPPVVDWVSRVPEWPRYLNDRYGDCVWAMTGHAIQAASVYGRGVNVEVTDADILKGYSDVTGFNPDDPSTDRGTVIQDALSYWRKVGVGGYRILAFAEVNHRNFGEVSAALNVFGHLMVGVDCPRSALDQFDRRQPWDVVAGDGGSVGGHAVTLGYDGARFKMITWGRVQSATDAWFGRYVRECWVVVLPEWLDAVGGRSPAGLDLYGLGGALAELTGGANPFPQPTPTPPPVPTPPPPVADPAAVALIAATGAWMDARHSGEARKVAVALQAFRAAKQLSS